MQSVHVQISLWAGPSGRGSCRFFCTAACSFDVLVARLPVSLINNSLKFPKLLLSSTFFYFTCSVLFTCGAVSALSSPDFFAYGFFFPENSKLFTFHGMKGKAWLSAPLCLVFKWHCNLAPSTKLISKIYHTKHI